MEDILQVKGLEFQVGEFLLGPVDLNINRGELFAVLGKTGAGKSLFLELIAGCYKNYKGIIQVNSKAPIGMVFQDYKLFPHMSVEENIGYGLKCRHMRKKQIKEEVEKLSEMLKISHLLKKYPNTLSGGEKQRTALARTLIVQPEILLLDEPFCALDLVTKQELYQNIIMVKEKFFCTILLVTHDFNEAYYLADKIGVLSDGKFLAVSEKEKIFEQAWPEEISRFFGIKEGKNEYGCEYDKRRII